MADSEGKAPITRRDLTVSAGVFAAVMVVLGFGGTWIFYSRIEGRVLEERVGTMKELDAEIVRRMNEIASEVRTLQLTSARLLELYQKALDKGDK